MTVYLIEKSLTAVLTAVFTAFERKETPAVRLADGYQPSLLNNAVEIKTDEKKAERVRKKLRKIGGETEYRIKTAFLNGNNEKYTAIFDYIVGTVKANADISENYSDKGVYAVYTLMRQVNAEAHRMKGFLRFSMMENGVYYAKFTPDNDILTLIAPHFKNRYPNMPFIIHDIKRGVMIASYKGESKTVSGIFDINAESADGYGKLFKTYYEAVFIKERENERQMRSCMPARYHKFMPEKNELL